MRSSGCTVIAPRFARPGIPHEPGLELQGDFTEPSGYEAAAELARMPGRPTAVFVANDHMAIGVLSGLLDSGVSVPNDAAVVGFDDIAMSRYTSPPLTTVRVNTTLLGERAVGTAHALATLRQSRRQAARSPSDLAGRPFLVRVASPPWR